MSNERKSLIINESKNSNNYRTIKDQIPLSVLIKFNDDQKFTNNQEDKNEEDGNYSFNKIYLSIIF